MEVAYGVMKFTEDMLQEDGTYTVTLQLRKPFRGDPDVPYFTGSEPFYGTARYFSIMITPQDVSVYKQDSIWIKGSIDPLNISKSKIDWDKSGLISMRTTDPGMSAAFGFPEKIRQLFEGTICNDSEIQK